MKHVKLYNLIFPIWAVMFLPPVIIGTLLGNLIIDSLVLIACFYVFKLHSSEHKLKSFYKKSILKVWGFGFLADFIGAAILFATGILGDRLGLVHKVMYGINYDPFSNIGSFLVIAFAMLVAGACIFVFNYYFVFRSMMQNRLLRLKVSLALAVITIPWTFLLPTKWFF